LRTECLLPLFPNRERIAEEQGINAEEMVFIHGLSVLEDDQALSVYGIQDGKKSFSLIYFQIPQLVWF